MCNAKLLTCRIPGENSGRHENYNNLLMHFFEFMNLLDSKDKENIRHTMSNANLAAGKILERLGRW